MRDDGVLRVRLPSNQLTERLLHSLPLALTGIGKIKAKQCRASDIDLDKPITDKVQRCHVDSDSIQPFHK